MKMRINIDRTRLMTAALVAGGLCGSAAAATWPGAVPCNGTLQTCVESTLDGVVEIATDAPIEESVTVDCRDMILRPAAGHSPTFAAGKSVLIVGCDQSVHATVEGLTLERGTITAVQGGQGHFVVFVRDNTINNVFNWDTAIDIRSGNTQPPYGPTFFEVKNNTININRALTDDVSAIGVGPFQTTGNQGSIVGNTIHQVGGDQQGAIEVSNNSNSIWVEIIGNHISGTGFNNGIELFQFSDGGWMNGRVVNNLVTGQTDSAGAPAGISFNVSQGWGDFTIVNNTVVGNDRGVLVNGRADLGAQITGVLANNIVANNSNGVIIDPDFAATFTNDHNLVWNNGNDSFTAGAASVFADPVLDATMRPLGDSPAVDAGSDLRIPHDIVTDLGGGPRKQGVVDIGAYEMAVIFASGFEDGSLNDWSQVAD